jgi:hypothetical protein
MEEKLIVRTEIACPLCGGKLELIENKEALYLGCPRCLCYTYITQYATRRFFDRRTMRFNWRRMLYAMYLSYLDLVQSHGCRRRR